LFFGLLWYPLYRRIKARPWWGSILFLLPRAMDGGTHLLSDLAGIGIVWFGFPHADEMFADQARISLARIKDSTPQWFPRALID
jgi:hypothetical protein